ncbi:MAG: dual specificity protein phosphatase family protein [Chloroflexi bacterium]|nr:dual specificity protein phosphatase family protein [Chloroflexota bacterium]MCC6894009.1 dual specificity protein phosphatase family protein [Anaerolineae bacterium]
MTVPQPIHDPETHLERKSTLRDLWKQFTSLQYGLALRGPYVIFAGLWDFVMRALTGAPMIRYSQVSPNLVVAGQYQKRGWAVLQRRGITASINMRSEFDDVEAGIAPSQHLRLVVEDNTPPSLDQLRRGIAFVTEEVRKGGKVYIHCAAGIGRAPTMAAAYLVSTGLTPAQAWAKIEKVRPFIRPTPGQEAQIDELAITLAEELLVQR